MKKIFGTAFALMLFSSSAWGLSIVGGYYDGRYVDQIDRFIAETDDVSGFGGPGGSEKAEAKWVNFILEPDVAFTYKTENVDYYSTTKAGVYAFNLGDTDTDYFVIKNADWWALFKNRPERQWGVFDTDDLTGRFNLGSSDFVISHVTRFNGGDVPIPEPATLLLFGAGLAGLAAVGRRKTK